MRSPDFPRAAGLLAHRLDYQPQGRNRRHHGGAERGKERNVHRHRRKKLFRLGNWLLLLSEGGVIGLCVGMEISVFRLVHDRVFPLLLTWFATTGERWWLIPLWGLIPVGTARRHSHAHVMRGVPAENGIGTP